MPNQITDCIICGTRLPALSTTVQEITTICCIRCGTYRASEELIEDIHDDERHPLKRFSWLILVVAHHIRRSSLNALVPYHLTSDILEQLQEHPYYPSLTEQLNNLIQLIGKTTQSPGGGMTVSADEHQYIIGSEKREAIGLLGSELIQQGIAEMPAAAQPKRSIRLDLQLTFAGWLRYEELRRGVHAGSRSFLAMPFNTDLDSSWLPSAREAVRQTGFFLHRIDDQPKPGLVDIRMRSEIRDCRFAIVELTHANLGAYWEAGFAEGLGKPVIYSVRKDHDKQVHFDTAHLTRIIWSPDALPRAMEELKAMIRIAFPDAKRDEESETL